MPERLYQNYSGTGDNNSSNNNNNNDYDDRRKNLHEQYCILTQAPVVQVAMLQGFTTSCTIVVVVGLGKLHQPRSGNSQIGHVFRTEFPYAVNSTATQWRLRDGKVWGDTIGLWGSRLRIPVQSSQETEGQRMHCIRAYIPTPHNGLHCQTSFKDAGVPWQCKTLYLFRLSLHNVRTSQSFVLDSMSLGVQSLLTSYSQSSASSMYIEAERSSALRTLISQLLRVGPGRMTWSELAMPGCSV